MNGFLVDVNGLKNAPKNSCSNTHTLMSINLISWKFINAKIVECKTNGIFQVTHQQATNAAFHFLQLMLSIVM